MKKLTQRTCLRAGSSLAVIALMTALSVTAAQAQDSDASAVAPEEDTTMVVVTGFRSSLAKAINLKRSENSATDSILAEDIGKFPDLNLSESIQRIPGVAITRDGGEGRQISVRGLGAQFTRVRINGIEAMATAGGADSSGGTNRGRGFDFNVFASDLFNSITVRKTAEAAIEEGSLGATVELRTARPFDYNGFKVVGSVQASYNDLAETTSPRAAFMISNTFADDKFGVLFSLAYTKRKTVEDGYSTVRWAKGSSFSPGFGSVMGTDCTTTPAACTEANDALHPRFPRYDYYQNDQERLGATLALQYRPSDRTLITFDALMADFKVDREEYYLEAPSFSQAGACTTATRPTTCGLADTNITAMNIKDGVMLSGTFDNVDLRVEDRVDAMQTKFRQASVELKHEFSDNLTLNGLVGVSQSAFDNPIQNTIIMDQYNVDNYSYDYSQGRKPVFGFGTAALTDPAAWQLSQIRLRTAAAKNDFATVAFDLNWRLFDGLSFQGGVNYKKYDFTTSEMRRSNGTTSNMESNIPAAIAAMAASTYTQLVSIGGTSFITPDYRKAVGVMGLYDTAIYGGAWKLGTEPQLGNNKSVTEEDTGAFVQTTFKGDVRGVTLRGNAGVRYVQTQQAARGFAFVNNVLTPITAERTYADWLPAANLAIEPNDSMVIRFAAAKVMSRPDLTSLPPGATINVSGANRTVSVGNPNLDPYRATNYDAAFEWYFKSGSILSLAVFQKDIASFVQTVSTPGQTFTGNSFGLPDAIATAACGSVPNCSPTLNNWAFSAPVNSPGGTLRGYEINYQQPFRFLPGWLADTGVLINYTNVGSRIDYLNSSGQVAATNDLTGLSPQSFNATIYYEGRRLSGRVSASHRDNYLTRVPGSEAGTDVDGTNGTLNIDASLQYTINRNLKLSLEAVNITDEYQDQFNDSRNLLSVYRHTGREFLIGLRYTY